MIGKDFVDHPSPWGSSGPSSGAFDWLQSCDRSFEVTAVFGAGHAPAVAERLVEFGAPEPLVRMAGDAPARVPWDSE